MLTLAAVSLAWALTDSQQQGLVGITVALIGAAGLVVSESVKTRRAAEAATSAAEGAHEASRGAHEASKCAHTAAAEARELARPTGNGFASGIVDRLDRIEAAQRGIRGDVAQVRSDVAGVRGLVTDHLQAHASSDVARH